MRRLIGRASASIKHLINSLPFFKELPQDATAYLPQLTPAYAKSRYILPAIALAGSLLALGGGSILTKQNLEVDNMVTLSKIRKIHLTIGYRLLNILQTFRAKMHTTSSNYW